MLIGSWHINCESPGKPTDPYNWSHSHSTIHRIHMLCLASWLIYTRFGLWYSRWTNYSNPASMSCRLPPVPQISTLWFRIFVPDLDFFSSIRRSKPNPKKQHCNWGCGGLLDYKGLNNSSIYSITASIMCCGSNPHGSWLDPICNPR